MLARENAVNGSRKGRKRSFVQKRWQILQGVKRARGASLYARERPVYTGPNPVELSCALPGGTPDRARWIA